MRGQGALCLVMALFYAVALSLIGLHHAVLIADTRRSDKLYPLSRIAHRSRGINLHCNCSVLA